MSARKSNKSNSVQAEVVEQVIESVVEVVEPVVEVPDVVGLIGEDVGEVPAEVIEKENKIVDLESEMVRLQERIKDIRKELRGLESKKADGGPTKMSLAVQYWKDHSGLQRKDYIEAFQKELGLTLAGAKTYIQLITSKAKAGSL